MALPPPTAQHSLKPLRCLWQLPPHPQGSGLPARSRQLVPIPGKGERLVAEGNGAQTKRRMGDAGN